METPADPLSGKTVLPQKEKGCLSIRRNWASASPEIPYDEEGGI